MDGGEWSVSCARGVAADGWWGGRGGGGEGGVMKRDGWIMGFGRTVNAMKGGGGVSDSCPVIYPVALETERVARRFLGLGLGTGS